MHMDCLLFVVRRCSKTTPQVSRAYLYGLGKRRPPCHIQVFDDGGGGGRFKPVAADLSDRSAGGKDVRGRERRAYINKQGARRNRLSGDLWTGIWNARTRYLKLKMDAKVLVFLCISTVITLPIAGKKRS